MVGWCSVLKSNCGIVLYCQVGDDDYEALEGEGEDDDDEEALDEEETG